MRGAPSSLIHHPLTLCPLEYLGGTHRIVYTVRHSVVVTELELGSVAVKVLTSTVLVDTLHATLED